MRASGRQRIAIEHGWEVATTPSGAHADPSTLGGGVTWHPARVPGTAAGALGMRDFDGEDVWWRVPMGGELTAGCVLGFDGIATLWDAWLDGAHVARGDSMWARRELVIDRPVRQLVIRCRSLTAELAVKRPRPRWKVPMLQQQQLRWFRTTLLGRTPGWSPPCPPVGPWRAVWIEQRTHRIGEIRITPSVRGTEGVVDVTADLPDALDAQLVVSRGAVRVVAPLARGERWTGRAILDPIERWWPHTHGEPALYDVALDVKDVGVIELGRVGFREIVVDDDLTVRVNGERVFCRGACWTPLDVVTLGATPEQLAAAVAQMRDAGMNMVRVSGAMAYEADAFHDALDAHGILLWQDLMFANMDYPEDPAFVATARAEIDGEIARLAHRPSLAIVCGNSEVEQQAAMFGAGRERWTPTLFHADIREVVRARSDVEYIPSSATGGAFPHVSNFGPSSYYGVGAYRRPLEDARRAEVQFASECLGFANIGDAVDKSRTPKDLGAAWDFDDVRDHYVKLLFGEVPADPQRYLELGRAATGEGMAQVFAEWRRAKSPTRGGLVWFLRDLWPCAGWGLIDAHGTPKHAWYALRRALQPIALAFSDEGTNGLVLHVHDETARALEGELVLELWRDGDVRVGRGAQTIRVEPRASLEIAATDLLEGFSDLSYAYRFGSPSAHVIHARIGEREAFWFPAGLPSTREPDVGLSAQRDGDALVIATRRFAQSVAIELPGWIPEDNGFHLAPGQTRRIAMRGEGSATGVVRALNSDAAVAI